jgi:hypothetical protein
MSRKLGIGVTASDHGDATIFAVIKQRDIGLT